MKQAGFTLIELMVSVIVLSIVTGIVFYGFASVTSSAEMVRAHAERQHLKQVLWRNLSANLASVYADAGCTEPSFAFKAESGDALFSTSASLRFTASLPMEGSRALPGVYRQVLYELGTPTLEEEEGDLSSAMAMDDDLPDTVLRITERPFTLGEFSGINSDERFGSLFDDLDPVRQEERVTEIPLQTFHVVMFDGEEWVETWDSTEVGMLPWAVRVRANFPRSREEMDEEMRAGVRFDEEADLDLTVALPLGAGVLSPWTDLNRARGFGMPDDFEDGEGMLPDELMEGDLPPEGGGIGTEGGTRRVGAGTGFQGGTF